MPSIAWTKQRRPVGTWLIGLGACALVVPLTATADQAEQDRIVERLERLEEGGSTSWTGGAPVFESPDGEHQFKVRGRLHNDAWVTRGTEDGEGDIAGTHNRRARLGIDGVAYDDFAYRLEGDFVGGSLAVRDMTLQYRGFGPWELTFGNKYLDQSFDGRTGSNFSEFMERGIIIGGTRPEAGSRPLGLTADVGGDNWHWSIAALGDAVDGSSDTSDDLSFVSRAHYAPIHSDDRVVHLGAWGYYEDLGETRDIELSSRIANPFNDVTRVESGVFPDVGSAASYGAEIAGVWGPLSATAEYMGKRFDSDESGVSPTVDGYLVSLGYFVTGETRAYAGRRGTWTRVTPENPVTEGGPGAIQLVARAETANYDDNDIPGTDVDALTAGVNWHLVSHVRLMLNATYFDTAGSQDDSGYHVGTRVQVDW
ncbi:OprO/OprP family phosphate-selective porin [Aquisalimonas asiatica]|uniref:Phosphate-selective porin OprO and OprP n=1 Tax=Aquisalimonas asiatica TaxID=406100 RepID=A0A1H8SY75_9GAMM|nr:porin [Aquisalimonas asiatica]SEO83929.1 phosphate-selective porin OprO and OprP [Aquisalimonas asiatica]